MIYAPPDFITPQQLDDLSLDMGVYMAAKDRCRIEEGLRYHAYDDATGKLVVAPIGKLSIGYGANIQDVGLYPEEVVFMLEFRLLRAWRELVAEVPNVLRWPLRVQQVLLEMAYNMGARKVGRFRRMLDAIDARDFKLAAKELLDSDAARRLENRYAGLAEILRG